MRTLVLAALILVAASGARGDEHRLDHPPPPPGPRFLECDPGEPLPRPCHVHDPRTAGRLHPHTPALKDPHARQEYEAWRAGRIPKMY